MFAVLNLSLMLSLNILTDDGPGFLFYLFIYFA